jgi:hypothetical protein
MKKANQNSLRFVEHLQEANKQNERIPAEDCKTESNSKKAKKALSMITIKQYKKRMLANISRTAKA